MDASDWPSRSFRRPSMSCCCVPEAREEGRRRGRESGCCQVIFLPAAAMETVKFPLSPPSFPPFVCCKVNCLLPCLCVGRWNLMVLNHVPVGVASGSRDLVPEPLLTSSSCIVSVLPIHTPSPVSTTILIVSLAPSNVLYSSFSSLLLLLFSSSSSFSPFFPLIPSSSPFSSPSSSSYSSFSSSSSSSGDGGWACTPVHLQHCFPPLERRCGGEGCGGRGDTSSCALSGKDNCTAALE